MVARRYCYSALPRLAGAVLAVCCALTAGAASAQTVNLKEYFPLGANSFWDYTGSGQPGSSSDDDFRWTVLATLKDISATTHATQIQTITVEPTDSRNGDIDYWYVNPENQLRYCGTKIANAHGSFPTQIDAQDVILSHPLLMGGNGQHIGDVVTDSSPASISVDGGTVLSRTINSTVTYVEIVPLVTTRLGLFTDVLHIVVSLDGTVNIFGVQHFNFKGSEFFLKKGVGMVKQDQNASANQAKDQILKDSQVNAVIIVPDGKNAAGLWTLYQ